jgi:hypothetical protein
MLPLSLGARESIFVVLRHRASVRNVTALEWNGSMVYSAEYPERTSLPQGLGVVSDGTTTRLSTVEMGKYRLTFADGKSVEVATGTAESIDVGGPWNLSFPDGWGAPPQLTMDRLESWTNSGDIGVRYFSGRATYRTTLQLTGAQAKAASSANLNLGAVHEVAAVRINGKAAGIVWKEPCAVRVDGLLHAGTNAIEVDVTNLWPNRLIGDAQDPNGKHYTWTNIRQYTKDSPLLPSGMLGPVRIEPVYNVTLSTPLQTDSSQGRVKEGGSRGERK